MTVVPVPDMPAPPPLERDATKAALEAEVAAAAARAAALREEVPARLRASAAALQESLRAATAAAADAAAAATAPAARSGAGGAGDDTGDVDDAVVVANAAGALVPAEQALALTTELADAVAALPSVTDRLQVRALRHCCAVLFQNGSCVSACAQARTRQTVCVARSYGSHVQRRSRWRACSAWWALSRRTQCSLRLQQSSAPPPPCFAARVRASCGSVLCATCALLHTGSHGVRAA